MSTLDSRPLRPTFLPSVNALLAALALPFAIDHPTDLTPSLFLAIFESLIGARLPIPAAVRQSRTRDAKARAMLVLLGVLECDVLRGGTSVDADDSIADAGGVSVDGWVDEIGLGEVDPERLADGGWEETIFVGELLCWLARRRGILPRTKSSQRQRSLYLNHHSYEGDTADFSTSLLLRPSSSQKSRSPPIDPDSSVLSHITDVPRHPLVHSPEPSLSASATTGTDLSIRARSVSSRTSVSMAHDDFEGASQDTIQSYDPHQMMQDAEEDDDRPPTFRPHCIHELEDPSYIRALAGSSSSFDLSGLRDRIFEDEDDPSRELDVDEADDLCAPPTPTPRRVRLSGWIEPVDSTTELSQFAASRAHPRSRAFNTSPGASSGPPQSHRHARANELPPRSRPADNPHTPRRTSPSPSPPPPTSSKYSPAPSSPSPPLDSDPPFDVSFSTLNNTSTPAKPHPPRRPRRRDRSPSYTPSPPSFSTPGSLRSGAGASGSSGTRPGPTGPRTHVSPPTTKTAGRRKILRSTSPSPTRAKGKSPPVSPPGSTATTNTLLTERARLLTELAALKRARATSNAGARTGAASSVTMGTNGSGNGVVGRRVGVGV